MPYLTDSPAIYGIYTVCVSLSIFLVYTDLGFVSAGQKYAAEHFARSEREEEVKLVGFTGFVLFIFLMLFSIGFLVLSFNPSLLVKDLLSVQQKSIASSLFLILAFFTPVTLLQRLGQLIFGIRLEDFIIQRFNTIASVLKIVSVLYFFSNRQYNIVGYFLFTQIVNLLIGLTSLLIAQKRYHYDLTVLLKAIKFDKTIFIKTKNIAFASLFLTLSWILYYELDSLAISKLLGVNQVAVYAIGLTLLSFFRSILGILFAPFGARFNHFVGRGDDASLQSFFIQLLAVFAPVVVISVLAITFLAQPIILSWVGLAYFSSIEITQFLILCNLFAFITYPAGMLLIAKEKQKEIYWINVLIPIIFWLGVKFTLPSWGLKSFAIFKMIAFDLSAFMYFLILLRFLNLPFLKLLKWVFKPLILPILFLTLVSFLIRDYLPHEKSKINLLIVGALLVGLIFFSFVLQYFTSDAWKKQVLKLWHLYKKPSTHV